MYEVLDVRHTFVYSCCKIHRQNVIPPPSTSTETSLITLASDPTVWKVQNYVGWWGSTVRHGPEDVAVISRDADGSLPVVGILVGAEGGLGIRLCLRAMPRIRWLLGSIIRFSRNISYVWYVQDWFATHPLLVGWLPLFLNKIKPFLVE